MTNETNQGNKLDSTDIFLKEGKKQLARKNLGKYPIIKKLFGEKWILEQINNLRFNGDGGVHGNELAVMLSFSPDEKMQKHFQENIKNAGRGDCNVGMMAYLQGRLLYEPLLKLEELEQNLGVLKQERRLNRTIDKAKNLGQFWQTLSEIEIAAYFKRKGMLKEIEPLINGKTPDLLIDLLSEDFCIEIFTPMPENFRNTNGEVALRSNRTRDQLWDKLYQLPKNKPSIIIINESFYKNSDTVPEAILGTGSLILPKDGTKEPRLLRQPDGIAQSYDISNLKAIILYERQFDGGTRRLTRYDIKPIIVEDGDNLSEEQRSILTEVFNSMIFTLA